MTEQSPPFFIMTVCVAIIGFAIHMLALRIKHQQVYVPLIMFFIGLGIILSKPIVASLIPAVELPVFVLSLPALLILPPSFWCYVEGLTHTTKWHFKRHHVKHFILPILGLIISILFLVLPTDTVREVLTDGGDTTLEQAHPMLRNVIHALLISTFGLILIWIIQSGYYVYAVFKRLTVYRQQLKQVFASTDSKEFYWISWLLIAIGSIWLLMVAYLILDNAVNSLAFSLEPFNILLLVLIWSVAIWALRHKPGFEDVYAENSESVVFQLPEDKPHKYQNSALSTEQAAKIATDVTNVMQQHNAYLDPNISLQKLAKMANTTPNYLSQTLNETLNMSFFDYINSQRVNEASERLKNSKASVLDIAMAVGFNSKSSFYTAFKKVMNTTPTEFRKQHELTTSNSTQNTDS